MQVFNKLWTDPNASCGNYYRVQWLDGSETGYPTDAIRCYAISVIADNPKPNPLDPS